MENTKKNNTNNSIQCNLDEKQNLKIALSLPYDPTPTIDPANNIEVHQ